MKKIVGLILVIALVFGMGTVAMADTKEDGTTQVKTTLDFLASKNQAPTLGSIGGEWAVVALARGDYAVEKNYYEDYYKRVVQIVEAQKGELHRVKYTEYSRVILALTAIGKDPTNVGGYNLLEKLADFTMVKKQGINGPIFALIALDSNAYAIPQGKEIVEQTTREKLLNYIIEQELEGGGFALTGEVPDADITAMAVQALANYKEVAMVKPVLDRAVDKLMNMKFTSSESISQTILALTRLGVTPSEELTAEFLQYRADNGGFRHTLQGEVDGMSTEQGAMALVAMERQKQGKPHLYSMIYFRDTKEHWAREEINYLAERNILSGSGNNLFHPNEQMTVGAFMKVLASIENVDITQYDQGQWYTPYMQWGLEQEIIDTALQPTENIKRQEILNILNKHKGVQYIKDAKLFVMTPDGAITKPEDTATRAEVAKIMATYVNYTKE